MKKNVIALLLAVVLAWGSIGASLLASESVRISLQVIKFSNAGIVPVNTDSNRT